MDIVLLINKFLEDKQELKTSNDSFNISGESIVSWDFANIPCPSMEELQALQPALEAQQAQAQINSESEALLASTDWMILRELDSGEPCPAEVKAQRAAARAAIVR